MSLVYINASLLTPCPHSQATSASFPGQWGCENNSKTCDWVNVLELIWDNSHQSSYTQYIGKQSLELKLLTQKRCNSWVGVIKIKAVHWCVFYKWLDKDHAMFRLSNWWGNTRQSRDWYPDTCMSGCFSCCTCRRNSLGTGCSVLH